MNAQIGKDENNKFGLHNLPNRNSEHFSLKNSLSCQTNKFQKRDGKLWTYTYLNNTKAQLNYILINK